MKRYDIFIEFTYFDVFLCTQIEDFMEVVYICKGKPIYADILMACGLQYEHVIELVIE